MSVLCKPSSEILRQFYHFTNKRMINAGLGYRTDLSICSTRSRPVRYTTSYPTKTNSTFSTAESLLKMREEFDRTYNKLEHRSKSRIIDSDQDIGYNSIGYGEITQGTLQKVLHKINEMGSDYSIDRNSIFLDIGSGMGKCVYHALIASSVRESWGVEIVHNRHAFAATTGIQFVDFLKKHFETDTITIQIEQNEKVSNDGKNNTKSKIIRPNIINPDPERSSLILIFSNDNPLIKEVPVTIIKEDNKIYFSYTIGDNSYKDIFAEKL